MRQGGGGGGGGGLKMFLRIFAPFVFVMSFKRSNWSNKKMLTGVHYSQLSMSPWNTKSYSVRERANRHLHFQISISLYYKCIKL